MAWLPSGSSAWPMPAGIGIQHLRSQSLHPSADTEPGSTQRLNSVPSDSASVQVEETSLPAAAIAERPTFSDTRYSPQATQCVYRERSGRANRGFAQRQPVREWSLPSLLQN